MGWLLRAEAPGAIYHVTFRAVEAMFRDDVDRERLLWLLATEIRRRSWILHAYCLMGNHVHLLVETPEPNLAAGMQRLLGQYVSRFNRRHGRRGPLLERRYHAFAIEREQHLAHVARYIVLNPVRAGLVATAADWPWNSYLATAGSVRAPHFLTTGWLLEAVGGSREGYAEFVAEPVTASLEGALLAA